MKIKILNYLAISLGLCGLLLAAPVAAMPSIAPTTITAATLKSDACAGLTSVDSTQGCTSDSNTAVNHVVTAVVNTLSFIVGAAAVIMVIMSGFKYITAGGDAAKISGAKNTLVYAVVGLVVVVLAQLIVHFTINTANNAVVSCPVGQSATSAGACARTVCPTGKKLDKAGICV